MSGYGESPFGSFPYGQGAAQSVVDRWLPRFDDAIGRLDIIEFDITNDAWEIPDVDIRVLLVNGIYETAWSTNTGFTLNYRRGSARIPIPHGHHYVLRRTTGWNGASIQIRVAATDLAGDVVSGQSQ